MINNCEINFSVSVNIRNKRKTWSRWAKEQRYTEPYEQLNKIDDGFWFPFVIKWCLSLNQQINELKKYLSGWKEKLNAVLIQENSNLLKSFPSNFFKKPVNEFTKNYTERIPVRYINKKNQQAFVCCFRV